MLTCQVCGGAPFTLGNYDQIVFGRRPDFVGNRIDAGFDIELPDKTDFQCDFVIEALDSAPTPVSVQIKFGDVWVTIFSDRGKEEPDRDQLIIEIKKGNQEISFPFKIPNVWRLELLKWVDLVLTALFETELQVSQYSQQLSNEDREELEKVQNVIESLLPFNSFAGAPIRSKPKRTYDLIRLAPDAEGSHTMPYLAELSRNNQKAWTSMKSYLQSVGKMAGLFDEITIKNFGGGPHDPFQVHIKEHKKDGEGEVRNLIDVGYGVNQIIPTIVDLRRLSNTTIFLLQQPEVHLHPSAQAALGSVFCDFASWGQQVVIETHSDHLIDRVRMEVRDGQTMLTKDDVLLLFFERDGSDVKIHPIRFDEEGNVVGAPVTYRRFFMEEMTRSIGW